MKFSSAFFFALCFACGGGERATVFVELNTDYLPGIEFGSVDVYLEDALQESTPARQNDGFVSGRRVAELSEVSPGAHLFRVVLVGLDGRDVDDRRVAAVVPRGPFGVSVVIARQCAASCPGAGDDSDATECFGGRCVPPDCRPDDTRTCGEAECEVDSECGAPVACAMALCVGGECLAGADDGRCADDELCVPTTGCVAAPTDAGMDGGSDTGVMDAGLMDAAGMVDVGVMDAGPPDTRFDVPPPLIDGGCMNGSTRACPAGVGECGGGRETCVGGSWDGVCVGEVLPSYELCGDDVDANCDGDASDGEDCCFEGTHAGHTYLFCNRNRGSWGSSIPKCEVFGSFDLTEVNDAAENAFLTAGAIGGIPYWIGLTDRPPIPEGSFQWSNGGTSSYRNWASGQPDDFGGSQDCVSIDGTTGQWDDQDCPTSQSFICESL